MIPTVGRALLVLGGAYVLRAVTESGVVPSLVGAAAGVAYALFWFVMADRSARHGRRGAAIAHGITATAIALPLVWETTVPFALVGPATAMAALLAISAAGLTVAWRHRLWPLVWVVTAASLVLLALPAPGLLPVFIVAHVRPGCADNPIPRNTVIKLGAPD